MSRGRNVDIFVKPDANEESGYKFWMQEGGCNTKMLVFNKTVDRMKKSERYKVDFKLHNTGGADLVFSKNKDKVMSVMRVDGPTEQCPPEGSKADGFYVDPTAYIQDKQLTVINEDKKVEFLSFALNFVPRGTQERSTTCYVCYDPVVSNQNGGED